MIDDFGIKKKSKTIRETGAKWSQFGAVSETRGLAFVLPMDSERWRKLNDKIKAITREDQLNR